jgi:hypothetical protein
LPLTPSHWPVPTPFCATVKEYDPEVPEFSPFPRSGSEVALNGGRWRRTDPAYLAAWSAFL